MAREPDGHDGGRHHRGVERGQLPDGARQVRAVVPVGAQHDLGVHPDAGLGEPLHPRQDLRRAARLAEQPAAERRVRRVDGHVERRQALLDDARQVRLVEVGQRDVVAVEEREPEVVVLHVEASPHSLRQLVDEAEHALVGARRDLGGPGRHQLEAERGAAPPEGEGERAAVAQDLEGQALVARVELEVDRVAERVAVDREDAVAGDEPRRGGGRARADRGDDHAALHGLLDFARLARWGLLDLARLARWDPSPRACCGSHRGPTTCCGSHFRGAIAGTRPHGIPPAPRRAWR